MSKRTSNQTLRRHIAAAALVAAMSVPIGAYAFAEDAASEAVTEAAIDESFDESFDDFEALPNMPEARGNVVDITEFTPPIEIEEAEPDSRTIGSGIASYYGKRFHGRRTANGERFDMNAMTAAHKTLPFGTKVRVTNPRNGKSVVVRINDRGPFTPGRTIDVSRAAATQIGLIQRGHGTVELAIIES